MALDRIELDNLVAGDDVATDLIATDHYQVVKHAFGAAGTANIVTSTATNPLPVALSDTDNAVLDDIAAQNTTTAAGFAAEGAALGSGVLLQGDDGTDRKNINVDATTGDVQVDVTNTVTVDGSGVTQPVSGTVTANPASGTIDTVSTVTTCNLAAETTKVIGTVNVAAAQTIATTNAGTFATQATLQASTAEIGKLAAGTAAIGKLAANSGVDIGDVDVTSISAGSNLVGDVGIGVRTTGGASFYLNQDTSAVASVKASAGTLYSIACFNTHTAAVYLNLYNVASGSVTLGTTTPSMQFVVPSNGATGAGFTINFTPGVAFGTAITVACATTYNGSADPGANLVLTNITYA